VRESAAIGCDVLVVGAGPAGAMAASRLARSGLDVLVVEKAIFPRDKLCGDFLTPGSLRLMREAGLVDGELASRPALLRGMNLVLGGSVARMPFPAGTVGWAIGRRDLDAGLARAARASGARMIQGFRVDSIEDRGPCVQAQGAGRGTGPLTIEAACVIDAGGRNALTPRRRSWRRPSRWPVRFAVGAWFESVAGNGDHGEMHVLDGGRGGYIGISPMSGGITGAAAVVNRRLWESGKRDAAGLLARAIGASPDLRRRFSGARAVTPVRGAGPLAHGASRFAENRLLIAGDAAAFVDPFTGEGIHAALLGGALAAEAASAILRGSARAAAGSRFERSLRRLLRPRFVLARSLQALLCAPAAARRVACALARREDLAAALISVTGGSAEPGSLLRASFLGALISETFPLAPEAAGPAGGRGIR